MSARLLSNYRSKLHYCNKQHVCYYHRTTIMRKYVGNNNGGNNGDSANSGIRRYWKNNNNNSNYYSKKNGSSNGASINMRWKGWVPEAYRPAPVLDPIASNNNNNNSNKYKNKEYTTTKGIQHTRRNNNNNNTSNNKIRNKKSSSNNTTSNTPITNNNNNHKYSKKSSSKNNYPSKSNSNSFLLHLPSGPAAEMEAKRHLLTERYSRLLGLNIGDDDIDNDDINNDDEDGGDDNDQTVSNKQKEAIVTLSSSSRPGDPGFIFEKNSTNNNEKTTYNFNNNKNNNLHPYNIHNSESTYIELSHNLIKLVWWWSSQRIGYTSNNNNNNNAGSAIHKDNVSVTDKIPPLMAARYLDALEMLRSHRHSLVDDMMMNEEGDNTIQQTFRDWKRWFVGGGDNNDNDINNNNNSSGCGGANNEKESIVMKSHLDPLNVATCAMYRSVAKSYIRWHGSKLQNVNTSHTKFKNQYQHQRNNSNNNPTKLARTKIRTDLSNDLLAQLEQMKLLSLEQKQPNCNVIPNDNTYGPIMRALSNVATYESANQCYNLLQDMKNEQVRQELLQQQQQQQQHCNENINQRRILRPTLESYHLVLTAYRNAATVAPSKWLRRNMLIKAEELLKELIELSKLQEEEGSGYGSGKKEDDDDNDTVVEVVDENDSMQKEEFYENMNDAVESTKGEEDSTWMSAWMSKENNDEIKKEKKEQDGIITNNKHFFFDDDDDDDDDNNDDEEEHHTTREGGLSFKPTPFTYQLVLSTMKHVGPRSLPDACERADALMDVMTGGKDWRYNCFEKYLSEEDEDEDEDVKGEVEWEEVEEVINEELLIGGNISNDDLVGSNDSDLTILKDSRIKDTNNMIPLAIRHALIEIYCRSCILERLDMAEGILRGMEIDAYPTPMNRNNNETTDNKITRYNIVSKNNEKDDESGDKEEDYNNVNNNNQQKEQFYPNTQTYNSLLRAKLKRARKRNANQNQTLSDTKLYTRRAVGTMLSHPSSHPNRGTYDRLLRLWAASGSPKAGDGAIEVLTAMEIRAAASSLLTRSSYNNIQQQQNPNNWNDIRPNSATNELVLYCLESAAKAGGSIETAVSASRIIQRMKAIACPDVVVAPQGRAAYEGIGPGPKLYALTVSTCAAVHGIGDDRVGDVMIKKSIGTNNVEESTSKSAIKIAFDCYNSMVGERDMTPTSEMYADLLNCSRRHLPQSPPDARMKLSRMVFEAACRDGMVNKRVLYALEAANVHLHQAYNRCPDHSSNVKNFKSVKD